MTEDVEAGEEFYMQFHDRMNQLCDTQYSYHAILLLSGGKDSAYILDRLKKEYPKLNILCVFVENGFSSPVAVSNAIHVTSKLKTDLIIVNSYINQFRTIFRNAFLNLKGSPSYGVVDKADGDFIFDVGEKTAKKMNIPMLIGGLSWVQLDHIFGVKGFEVKKDIPVVHPLAVWRTNEQDIRSYVQKYNLLPPGNDNPVVTNNRLILPMCAIDVMNMGYCSFEPEFAQLIREKKTDRKTWLHNFELLEFATRKGVLNKEINEVLAKLDLTLEDIVTKPYKFK